jgi:hypothetical protein
MAKGMLGHSKGRGASFSHGPAGKMRGSMSHGPGKTSMKGPNPGIGSTSFKSRQRKGVGTYSTSAEGVLRRAPGVQ